MGLMASGQALTLIDSTTYNGSFEAGVLSPWSGGSVVQDPLTAVDGEWYGEAVAIVNRASLFLFFTAPDPVGMDFVLSFYAKTGAVGFDALSPYLMARGDDGEFIYAEATWVSGGALSDTWTAYTFTFRFDEAWDVEQTMSVGVNFSEGQVGSIGFLDAVALTQVPEPASAVGLAAGAALLYCTLKRKRRHG